MTIHSRSVDDPRTVHVTWEIVLRRSPSGIVSAHEFETEDEALDFRARMRECRPTQIMQRFRYHP